jgi:hypothetical protein
VWKPARQPATCPSDTAVTTISGASSRSVSESSTSAFTGSFRAEVTDGLVTEGHDSRRTRLRVSRALRSAVGAAARRGASRRLLPRSPRTPLSARARPPQPPGASRRTTPSRAAGHGRTQRGRLRRPGPPGCRSGDARAHPGGMGPRPTAPSRDGRSTSGSPGPARVHCRRSRGALIAPHPQLHVTVQRTAGRTSSAKRCMSSIVASSRSWSLAGRRSVSDGTPTR